MARVPSATLEAMLMRSEARCAGADADEAIHTGRAGAATLTSGCASRAAGATARASSVRRGVAALADGREARGLRGAGGAGRTDWMSSTTSRGESSRGSSGGLGVEIIATLGVDGIW